MSGLTKVPEITLAFWIIKILAPTLGETGGDTVTMTLNWGYLAGTALFFAFLVVLVSAQIRARRFHPALYWAAIVASTTFGTTLADFADRSLGIGYAGGATALLTSLLLVLGLWYRAEGTISATSVTTPRVEAFYWAAITLSQTLGTALGDWVADTSFLGYFGGALVFAVALAVVYVLYRTTQLSRVLLFWAAFILTRPLGATLADFLDKPIHDGGLDVSRPLATGVIAVAILLCIALLPQRPGPSEKKVLLLFFRKEGLPCLASENLHQIRPHHQQHRRQCRPQAHFRQPPGEPASRQDSWDRADQQ